jgi:hypothetical protein
MRVYLHIVEDFKTSRGVRARKDWDFLSRRGFEDVCGWLEMEPPTGSF